MDAQKMAQFQLQMRENQEELNDFVSGLGSWASEMKEKEKELKSNPKIESSGDPPIRNSLLKKKRKKTKKPVTENPDAKPSNNKKIHAYDYRAWDKFDVDAACAAVDDQKAKEEDDEETDEEWEEERRDLLSKQEKERGNAHFKASRWDDAVECYTTAIRLAPSNPLLYTNRAMAQLKAERFAAAEADCSEALNLEPACAKALYRRGIARKALGGHRAADALADFEALLRLEPQNKAAAAEAKALEKIVRPTGEVKAVHKAPSARSKKPLRRIAIEQIGGAGDQKMSEARKPSSELTNFLRDKAVEPQGEVAKLEVEKQPVAKQQVKKQPVAKQQEEKPPVPKQQEEKQPVAKQQVEKQPVAKQQEEKLPVPKQEEEKLPVPKQQEETQPVVKVEAKQMVAKEEEGARAEEEPLPRSFTQFSRSFAALRFHGDTPLLAFLRRIPPASYPALFGQCLEPVHLAALLRALSGADPSLAAAGLRALRATPRFSFLAMMIGSAEKAGLRDLRDRLLKAGQMNQEEADRLRDDFRL